MDGKEEGRTISTMYFARSASCWAICFCSTALVNSCPNVRLTIDTSSKRMLNSFARFSSSCRIRAETCNRNPKAHG